MRGTKISPDKISTISYHFKQVGGYKWYEKREAVYETKWFGLCKTLVTKGQPEGWCRYGGRYAAWNSDDDLVRYGYEIVIMPTGDKVCYKKPNCTIYFGKGQSLSHVFETDDEMTQFLKELEAQAGRTFVDLS